MMRPSVTFDILSIALMRIPTKGKLKLKTLKLCVIQSATRERDWRLTKDRNRTKDKCISPVGNHEKKKTSPSWGNQYYADWQTSRYHSTASCDEWNVSSTVAQTLSTGWNCHLTNFHVPCTSSYHHETLPGTWSCWKITQIYKNRKVFAATEPRNLTNHFTWLIVKYHGHAISIPRHVSLIKK